jgi:hypothetical protein
MLGSGGTAPPFLTSALDGGEWLASRPGRFAPGERVTGVHRIGGWGVGSRAGLGAVGKGKAVFFPEIKPGTSSP